MTVTVVESSMDIARIIAKKIKGTLSDQEQEYLGQWINESEENAALFYRLLNSGPSEDISTIARLDENEEWRKVLEKSSKKESKNNNAFQLRSLLKYAAIFIGIVGLGYGYWEFDLSDRNTAGTEDPITLQLENGEVRTITTESRQDHYQCPGQSSGPTKGGPTGLFRPYKHRKTRL